MVRRRKAQQRQLRARVRIGPGGLVPVALLALIFAAVGAQTNVPVVAAAFMGGIGGAVSLLVHELGHVRAARKFASIRSAEVSLIWLGALSRFEGTYESGGQQARVAVAGPRASATFGAGLLLLGVLPQMPFASVIFALGLLNILLALLNLVPVCPLDGHKLVVGLLWAATGSERKAKRFVHRIGIGWAALELPSVVVLVFAKPQVGVVAAMAAAAFVAQKRFARASSG
jgi:Zn-dependent protease